MHPERHSSVDKVSAETIAKLPLSEHADYIRRWLAQTDEAIGVDSSESRAKVKKGGQCWLP